MDIMALIQKARELGFQYEKDCQNCCQSTIAALQDTLGLQNDAVFKAGSGMAGGIGIHCDGVCGGYSGGVMMLSSLFGRERADFSNPDAAMRSFELASKLHQKFMNEYSTVICTEIHQKVYGRTFNLWKEEDFQAIEAKGSHVDKCTNVVANASAWAAEIILDEMDHEKRSI